MWNEFQHELTRMVNNHQSCHTEPRLVMFGQDMFDRYRNDMSYIDARNEYSIPLMAHHIQICNSGKDDENFENLFGIVNVLWLLAWDTQCRKDNTYAEYLHTALNILGEKTRRNMDFIESSNWPIKSSDIIHALDNPGRDMLPLYVHSISVKPFVISTARSFRSRPKKNSGSCIVWEIGVHAALSDEVSGMIIDKSCEIHRLIVNQYPIWRPQAGATSDNHFNEDVTVLQNFFETRLFWSQYSPDVIPHAFFAEFKTLVESMTAPRLLLCTLPILCFLFADLGWNLLGYFGHPLLFMVADEDKGAIIDWARTNLDYVVSDPFLAMQYEYLLQRVVSFVRTLALYVHTTWKKETDDILVWERPHDVTLMCSIQRAMSAYAISNHLMELPLRITTYPSSSQLIQVAENKKVPIRFVSKSALSDRSYSAFSKFRAVVIFPYDMDLVAFYEFAQMGIPILIPGNIDKYFFFQNHKQYDFPQDERRQGVNPFNEFNANTTRHNLENADYFRFPNISKFANLHELVRMVHEDELPATSFPQQEIETIIEYWKNVWETV